MNRPDTSKTTGNPMGSCGCSSGCGPIPEATLGRRTFLKVAGLGASAAALPTTASGQTATQAANITHFVPAEKNLPPEWVRSLTAKGEPAVYRGEDLKTLAMPIGGIGAGQLYLLGDGTPAGWSIFNRNEFSGVGERNYNSDRPISPVAQGFAVIVDSKGKRAARRLCAEDFPEVAFRGDYPIGKVTYERADFPVRIEMEAFSPFIPLQTKDSALPATVFNLTVENTGDSPAEIRLVGWLENAVCCHSAEYVLDRARRVTEIVGQNESTRIVHGAREVPAGDQPPKRPDVLIADFEGDSYGYWKVEGQAPGTRPATGPIANQSPIEGFEGKGFVDTYPGTDEATGKLISPPFEINRRFINLKVGGGKDNSGKLAVNLVVDGKVVRSVTGENEERLKPKSWGVSELAGKQAHIEIVDERGGGWGHINVDHIVLSDECETGPKGPIPKLPDFGTMALTLAGRGATSEATRQALDLLGDGFKECIVHGQETYGLYDKRTAAIGSSAINLQPGASSTITFVLSWHFPNQVTQESEVGHAYADWFSDASDTARYVLASRNRLFADTRKWRDTLYDSTLPWWLLDRLHSTISYLATNTCQYWAGGRFWAWEGVYCCFGTCTHVWNYAHGAARLFPELERSVRVMQDLGAALQDDGLVGFRGNKAYAADGQAGTILKCYREHQTAADDSFLKTHWPKIRKALEYSMTRDGNDDGLIEDSQHNTYDINFFGPNTFVGSLYLAALRAGEEMAKEAGDTAFAERCRKVFERGSKQSAERLFNGEYFIQIVDLKEHPKHQYGQGCLSDQLFGQGWADQVGLGYIYPREQVLEALRSIWKYNWAVDIGPQNDKHKPWRWFARPGEAGLFVCTWPKSEHLDQGVLYQNEVWTGGEYQVAGHLIWEGMLTEGLAMVRAIHDRYHPARHNPYNEVECGDHYARALASWGVYTALCGFRYHGPRGFIAFGPRITPEDFRAAFTAAEGWGTFSQKRDGDTQAEQIDVRWGRLRLKTLAFDVPADCKAEKVAVSIGDTNVDTTHRLADGRVTIELSRDALLTDGQSLHVVIA